MLTPRPPADERLICVRDLRMRFGPRPALDGLSFEVGAGEVVALLGPNGAGKTTTLSILATLLHPDAGTATVAGHDTRQEPAAARRALGVVPQLLGLYPTLTARENLLFFARLLGMRPLAAGAAVGRMLTLVGLDDRADDLVATFSGGMQRRLNLAGGLLHQPRVLLLDEPTAGVDPQSRERILTAVRAQAADGAAVLYSTHYMEEAERCCDRVVLIDHGRVVATGSPVDLIKQVTHGMRLTVVTRNPLPGNWLNGIDGVRTAASGAADAAPARGNRAQVIVDEVNTAPGVLARVTALGDEVLELHVHQPDLQDVFLTLTGRDLRD